MKHKSTNRKNRKQIECDSNHNNGNVLDDTFTMAWSGVENWDNVHNKSNSHEALTMMLNGFKYGVEVWDDSYIRMSDLLLTMIEDRLPDFYDLRFIKFINQVKS